MTPESLLASDLARLLTEFPLLRAFGHGVALIAVLFLIVLCFEVMTGANVRRYRSRPFVTDAIYAIVYHGGIYNALLYVPVFTLVAWVLPAWNVDLISNLPGPVGFLVYWVAVDAIGYWIHRWQHASPILWCFHSVHHTQTCLTFATSLRNHLFEQLFVNLLIHLPLMVIGMPRWFWAPVMLLQAVFEAVQHSDLNWRYGPLYPIVVSPVFHAIHHSPEPERHNGNYGKILSVWDWAFGTMSKGPRPVRYGVAGLAPQVTFWSTFVGPFKLLRERWVTRVRGPLAAGTAGPIAPDDRELAAAKDR